MKNAKFALLAAVSCTGLAMFGSTSQAGVVFVDGLSSGGAWTVAGDADTSATFGYDYSADGIPAPPGGSDTIGLKMEANITAGTAAEVAAVRPLGFSGSPYRVSMDIWTNFSIADGSSTEFTGAGVGHNGVATGRNGASLIVTGDGGSSRDYRMYKDDGEQFFASLQYGPTLASNNGSDGSLAATFLGLPAPAAQGQAGTSDAGDSAFQWLKLQIDVDPFAIKQGTTTDPGTAMFTLSSAASGNSVVIGTIDNSNGGDVVNMEGNLALIHADLFSSLAGDPQFQFGIFDNVVVDRIPEPSAVLLAFAASLGLILRRRR